MIENQEFIQDFVEEAKGHIESVEAGLLKIDELSVDLDVINDIFRAVHSVKGTAGFFNLAVIVELSHSMENLLGELRNGNLKVNQEIIDLLLKSNDCLKAMVEDVLESENMDITEYVEKLAMFIKPDKVEDAGESEKKSTYISNKSTKTNAQKDSVKEKTIPTETTVVEVAQEDHAKDQSLTIDQQDKEMPVKNQGIAVEDSIRVHVTLLNNLLNLASEMVLGRNQLLRTVEKYRKDIPGVEPILQNIDRITTELQEKVMQTRMQPVANVFNKFPRIIRDLSKKLGKEVELQLEGVDVELDKSIIEALGDPMTHLVRNAVDHGLEMPKERENQGKPRLGRIILKAYHEGGYVNIDIIDDGAGIDIEKVKEKALEKELISKSELSAMGEQDVLQLLFRPGFSTADKITDVSGRGVGMDVVKTNIGKLGGTVEIFTSVGKGTTFRLLLPLTLAIIPSLIVEVESQKFALPQVNLQEIVRIKPGDNIKKIEYIHNSQVLRLRGRLLPIIHLADVLELNRTFSDPVTGKRKEERRKTFYDQRSKKKKIHTEGGASEILPCKRKSETNTIRILVLKIGSRKFGLAVDVIHGGEEILVKPLSKFVKECKCYSGVTIMGDGKAAMILDPEGIIDKAALKFVDEQDDKPESEMMEASEAMKEQQNLLLFKCSGPETFGIDLSMVSRVEEISLNDIEKIGDKEYIKFRGDSLRLIRPEEYLPVGKGDSQSGKLYVIIPKLVKHPLGILIQEINDTMEACIRFNKDDMVVKGLTGSTILNNRIVLLINVYELFELADPAHYMVDCTKKAGENITILLVEDTPFFLKQEKSYLESAGYNILTAQNGKEALRILEENCVDLVVSDINMPVMDGLELVKRIRQDKRFASLPVIAVTSLTGELQMKAGLDAGFDFYEFKLDKSRLLEKVECVLSKRRKAI